MSEEGFRDRDAVDVDAAKEVVLSAGMWISIMGIWFFFIAMLPIFGLLINPTRSKEAGRTITCVIRRRALYCLVIVGVIIKTLLSTAMTIFWWNNIDGQVSNWKFLFTIGTFILMTGIAFIMVQAFVHQFGRMFVFGFAMVYLILAGVLAGLYTDVTVENNRKNNSVNNSRMIYGTVVVWVNFLWTVGVACTFYKVNKEEAEAYAKNRRHECAPLINPPCDNGSGGIMQNQMEMVAQEVTRKMRMETTRVNEDEFVPSHNGRSHYGQHHHGARTTADT